MIDIKKALIGMSPKQTWDYYVDSSVEMFLSNFRYEVPQMDIEKMIKIYTGEIPELFEDMLFSTEHLKEIEEKLLIYLKNYICSRGGIENLDLYTEEELEEIAQKDLEKIIAGLARKFNVSTDIIRAELRKRYEKDKYKHKKNSTR